ncbi:murein DD-endopeptidase MepM/ murein hydrolase activator NlpD [Chryseobacterium defluvii]|uniref:Murein DD-endopeptidase MepM/ murein hydrolase activator NlpD n=1 Tax=Chryseobacterium defluvii TaxID=160396 RepID=A0A840KB83_9FLAO|nr:peptidoglycan DD-metalloendopeptidase family protein [Chryseobacterium defluvii]MBB4804860.1 murein DD-endopeptidase MepM/ murein hydrolase activator NlpD [Chryseobacterium defluvii]
MNLKFVFLSVLASSFINAQHGGGEFSPKRTECLSESDRVQINSMLTANKARLTQEKKLSTHKALAHPLFIWPVQKSPGSPYNEVWSISNHVDHNLNYPNQLQDWNCGTRTYDTSSGNHRGIDIFTWPFGWYQMDNNQAQVVAAAPGIIVGKSNGNYDRNCAFNSDNWNAIYVQHSDGSTAWYGHMKNNSLTAKGIGESVSAGEYLGIIGSSGNSTGPHLHFEVYNSSNELVDPYQGACNTWPSSTDTWWQSQKPYLDPKINGIFTHSSSVIFNNGCGVQETTNFKNAFNMGEGLYVYIYLADIPVGTPANMKLTRPDNTIAYNSNFNINTFYAASYWYWSIPSSTFNQNGNWKASVTINGQTVTHNFTFGTLSTLDIIQKEALEISNPVMNQTMDILYKSSKAEDDFVLEIISMDGKLLKKSKVKLKEGVNTFPFTYEKGNYIVTITNGQLKKSFKIINQ